MKKIYFVIITILLLGIIGVGTILYFNYRNAEKAKNPQSSDYIEYNTPNKTQTRKLVVFHNGAGPMCLEALEFFDQNGIVYEEHLTYDEDFSEELAIYRSSTDISEGVSTTYGYYPYIFVGGKAFSGFNDWIGKEIMRLAFD
ncbi:hypothetical protein JW796_00555 [Candidatus Dojkabacteria bacterium]|nr:hypothetical protein [Candidatus Dojkabacteria bacterium]